MLYDGRTRVVSFCYLDDASGSPLHRYIFSVAGLVYPLLDAVCAAHLTTGSGS